jgi:hypothetical protein
MFSDAFGAQFAVCIADLSRLAGRSSVTSSSQLFDSENVSQMESEFELNRF